MPKVALRDLFFLVTLAAVLVAWWVDHRRLVRERDATQVRFLERAEAVNFWVRQWENASKRP